MRNPKFKTGPIVVDEHFENISRPTHQFDSLKSVADPGAQEVLPPYFRQIL